MKRFETCAVHDWTDVPLRQAASVKGEDGYRLLKRCRKCKRTHPGRFIPIESAIQGQAV
jgi:hypothetical protein